MVQEFHGSKHQVYFNGEGAWARDPARCELCDLAIVSYSTEGGFHGKLTFLQAKLDRDVCPADVCQWFLGTPIKFKANLEQWDLLSRRPNILPVRPFVAPPDLLSGAELASVGSFGVFHRTSHSKEAGFFYAAADCLVPNGSPSTRSGTLMATGGLPHERTVGGEVEQIYCPDIASFGTALFDLKIGTPIEDAAGGVSGSTYRKIARHWLGSVIATHTANQDSDITEELNRHLSVPDDEIAPMESVPSLVVIRSDRPSQKRG